MAKVTPVPRPKSIDMLQMYGIIIGIPRKLKFAIVVIVVIIKIASVSILL